MIAIAVSLDRRVALNDGAALERRRLERLRQLTREGFAPSGGWLESPALPPVEHESDLLEDALRERDEFGG